MSEVNDKNNARYLKYRSKFFISEFFGTAVISGNWDYWWIYWIGLFSGALLASLACSLLAKRITIAKLYHFDSESEGDALLRRTDSQ